MKYFKSIIFLFLIIPTLSLANKVIKVDTSPESPDINSEFVIKLNFQGDPGVVACGVNIDWGDGEIQKLRIGNGQQVLPPYGIPHIFKIPGPKKISVKGEFIARGLSSVGGCDVNVSGQILVQDPVARAEKERIDNELRAEKQRQEIVAAEAARIKAINDAEEARKLEEYKKTPAYKKEQQELARKKLFELQESKRAQELEEKRLAGLKKLCDFNTEKRFSNYLNGANIPNSLMIIGIDNAMDKRVGNELDSSKKNFSTQIVNVGDAQFNGKTILACHERFVVYKINRSKGERSESCFSVLYMYDKEFETYRGIESFFCSDDEKKIPNWIKSNTVTGFKY